MRLYNFIFTTFFSVFLVYGKNYILVPKRHVHELIDSVNLQDFATEHNLIPLATLPLQRSLQFYTTDASNLENFQKTLSALYDIEEDSPFKINFDFSLVEKDAQPWHRSRVVHRKRASTGDFPYNKPNSCHTNHNLTIDTYIVDTGIDITHPQFEGRAVWGANFADDKDTDCNSHGTHVAGLVGSRDFGMCVDANLHAVKVLSCDGSGSLSGVIKGIEWAYNSHKSKTKNETSRIVKSVINMSLGGGHSSSLNRAVESCVESDQHFYVVVAAGNDDEDSCNSSPAGARSIITVMASDRYDSKAYFSNWGTCANIYAPGVDVLSTVPNGETAVYSGTSMASPVMTGVLNHYIDQFPGLSMKTMLELVTKFATKNAIENNALHTVNILVFLHRN
jgi:cerevisin